MSDSGQKVRLVRRNGRRVLVTGSGGWFAAGTWALDALRNVIPDNCIAEVTLTESRLVGFEGHFGRAALRLAGR